MAGTAEEKTAPCSTHRADIGRRRESPPIILKDQSQHDDKSRGGQSEDGSLGQGSVPLLTWEVAVWVLTLFLKLDVIFNPQNGC